MATWCVSLFGKLDIRCGHEPITDHFPRRLQELLCFTMLHRHRSHPRERLAGIFWGESSTVQSRKNLRQALWQLKAICRTQAGLDHQQLLSVEDDHICLNPGADLWLDLAIFEQALVHTRGIAGVQLDAEQAKDLRRAVELYRGDLLEGWYQEWCLFERDRLRNSYLIILDKLMDHFEMCGEYDTGLAYGILGLRNDGARERTHLRLMRLHYLAGDRTAALRQYDLCAAALRRDLGVAPSAQTVALYQKLRDDRYTGHGRLPMAQQVAPAPSASQLSQVLKDLHGIQRSLNEAQSQLQKVIHSTERCVQEQP